MATSKPDILVILLSKLMEEGDLFYKVRGLQALATGLQARGGAKAGPMCACVDSAIALPKQESLLPG